MPKEVKLSTTNKTINNKVIQGHSQNKSRIDT